MKVPSGPARTPDTISSLPVQTLVRPASTSIGAAGSACQPAARTVGGCAEEAEPPWAHAMRRNAMALPSTTRLVSTTTLFTKASDAGDILRPPLRGVGE